MSKKPAARKPKIQAVATAKAEISAKASYQRNRTHTISETIPEDVTRSKASAWLDVISPAREWLGMKGDIIHHRREQLRAQQAAILSEIERRAAAALPPGATINAVPSKFVVPLLEQAGLEEPGSPLIELWANLLASAATSYDGQYLHFSRLIAGLSPEQALLFKEGFTTDSLHGLERCVDNIEGWLIQPRFIKAFAGEVERARPQTDDDFCAVVIDYFDTPVVEMVHVAAEGDDYFDVNFPYRMAQDADEVDYDILSALGLIQKVSTPFVDFSNEDTTWSMTATYYHLTRLGLAFARACKMAPEGEPPSIPPAKDR